MSRKTLREDVRPERRARTRRAYFVAVALLAVLLNQIDALAFEIGDAAVGDEVGRAA